MKVSIVISVFNEEAVLDKFYEAFENFKSSLKWDYELIFVNDGSRDKSLLMLSEFAKADDRIKVISFSRNFG